MNLLYLNEHICACPPLTNILSLSDDGDLVRIVIDPDNIPSETHFELMATFAEEHMMPHFAEWEDSVEFAFCFVLDGDDCMVLLEVSHPSGIVTHFSVDASEEEIATMLAPLVVATDMTEHDYDALAGMIPGLDFGGKYSVMVKNLADTIVALCYYRSVTDNPILAQLPHYERAFEKSLPRFVPCLIQPFIDIGNAMKAVGRA